MGISAKLVGKVAQAHISVMSFEGVAQAHIDNKIHFYVLEIDLLVLEGV